MPLVGYPGKLLANPGGNIASSAECCCDNKPDQEDDGPVEPTGPNCPCARFGDCTVTVRYDGFVKVATHKTLVALEYKSAGIWAYRNQFSALNQLSFDRSISILPRLNCSSNTELVTGTCGVDDAQVFHHLRISYGMSFFDNFFTSYYRFNVDADEAQPCPASVAGLNVTVSEVHRTPGNTTFLPNCYRSCEQTINQIKAQSGGFYQYLPSDSYRWQNIVWGPNQGPTPGAPAGPDPLRGNQISPIEPEDWICNAGIEDKQHPFVSVVCPP